LKVFPIVFRGLYSQEVLERSKSKSVVIFLSFMDDNNGVKDVICKEYVQSLRRIKLFVPALMRCK